MFCTLFILLFCDFGLFPAFYCLEQWCCEHSWKRLLVYYGFLGLCVYLEVKSGHRVCASSTSQDGANCFSKWLYQLTIPPAVYRRFCCSKNSLPIQRSDIYPLIFVFIFLLHYSLIELELLLVYGVKWEPGGINNPFSHHCLLIRQVVLHYTFKSFSYLLSPDDSSDWISVSFYRVLLNNSLKFCCDCIRSIHYFGLKPTLNSLSLYSQIRITKVLTA